MKNRVPKCFRLQSQTMSNDGQVGFMKIDFAEIPRSRKASAAMGTRYFTKESKMKKEDGVKLSKRSADGKIAYLIKPILKVLQDAGGQLERAEIKERIADLDVRECKAQTNSTHRVRIPSSTIKSFANNS